MRVRVIEGADSDKLSLDVMTICNWALDVINRDLSMKTVLDKMLEDYLNMSKNEFSIIATE